MFITVQYTKDPGELSILKLKGTLIPIRKPRLADQWDFIGQALVAAW